MSVANEHHAYATKDDIKYICDKMDNLFDKLDNKIDGLENRVDSKFNEFENKINSRFNEFENKVNIRFNNIESKLNILSFKVWVIYAGLGAIITGCLKIYFK